MKSVVISAPRYLLEHGRTRVSATIGIGEELFEIWYRVSAGPLAGGLAGFLPATLTPAMRMGRHLQFAEPLSPRLLEAVPKIQDIFHAWNPDWRRISIDAPAPPTFQRRAGRSAAACFF